ncbi:MAG: small multi-drug export protein [Kiritimatiellaeota bacterium]|nr:small multi-drug export protein [Kiritimatiellota bacterium]
MLKQVFFLTVVTLIPALELRASIPYGVLGNEKLGITPGMMSWPVVVLVCVVANIVLGWGVFWVLGPCFNRLDRFAWFSRCFRPILDRTRARLKPYVDRYGTLGVAVFIGVPLPGSGVYTGALGAFLLGVDRRKFAVANVLGVLIAAMVVTGVTLTLKAGMQLPWLDWIVKTAA